MADVARRFREADRAQLFLVGALALSVIFIVLAVLLNTAIYTGNIATRDPGPGAGDVSEYESAAKSMANHTIVAVNDENNSSYTALQSSFTETVSNWSDTASVHTAATLTDAHVEIVTTEQGSMVGQEHRDALTSDNGDGNWTVVNNSSARAFRLNVSQSSLLDISVAGVLRNESFYVGFDDGSGEWRTYFYREGTGNVSIDVVDPSDTQVGSTCSVDPGADGFTVVKLSTARLGNQSCPAFTQLFENMSGRYNVSYGNAVNAVGSEKVNGTYSVIVDRPLDRLATGADDTSDEPYAADAMYSADLKVTYRSSVSYYRVHIRVAPEEPDV
ncbi:MAG: hypothetical protein ABEH90_00970 [Halolamina sp.]